MFLVDAWINRWRILRRAKPEVDTRIAIAVVTGGSDGIGLALARELGHRGHRLLLVARNQAKLDAAAAELGAELGVPVATAAIDIKAPYAISLLDSALERLGAYCDILVNSAGIGLAGPFDRRTSDETAGLIDLNIHALTRLTRHYLPRMRARARGGIINVASAGGYAPGPWQAAYYASKAYVISLTEAIGYETRGEGVRVCVITPGPVITNFHERMRGDSALYLKLLMPLSPERVARVGARGFSLGRRVIVPGILNTFIVVALRLLPHIVVIPIVGFLLKPRAWGSKPIDTDAGEQRNVRGESR